MKRLFKTFLKVILYIITISFRKSTKDTSSYQVVDAGYLLQDNISAVEQILSHLDIQYIYTNETCQQKTYFVDKKHSTAFFRNYSSLKKMHLVLTVSIFASGFDRHLAVTTQLCSWLCLVLAKRERLDSIRITRKYKISESKTEYINPYCVNIRFLKESNGWWVNLYTDQGSAPIQQNRLKDISTPSVKDINFPIDIVYTWVDGNDQKWIKRKNTILSERYDGLPLHSTDASRWENRNELLYSLRSLAMYAPWIRKIFIVTDQQSPKWLKLDDKIKIIDHRDIFPKDSMLPTYNSHAIETVLHKIQGLAEHFLYLNDDMLFGAPVDPSDFFTPGGLTKIFLSKRLMPIGTPEDRSIASEWGGMNASSLLEELYNKRISHKGKHAPYALRKSILEQLEIKFKTPIEKVRNTQFRSTQDIAPINVLYMNLSLIEGYGVEDDISSLYINICKTKDFSVLMKTMDNHRTKVFCLNDDDSKEKLSHKELQHIENFLRHLFPWKSPWEL